MRKLWIVGILALLLCGCSQPENLETVSDEAVQLPEAEKMATVFSLPPEAVLQTMEEESAGQLYFCDGYTVQVRTVPGGDLHATLQMATGYSKDQLDVIETVQGNSKRYICVFASASETGDQVGRCCVLDDGYYHYVLTVMADAAQAGELAQTQWQGIFNSFRLMDPQDVVSSGS